MGPDPSHEAVLEAERRGELLMAFDLAERALDEHPDDLWLKHRAVLALARAGSTGEAARHFTDYGLGVVKDEDVAALEARIAKDQAIGAGGGFADAARLYEAIFRRTGGYYTAVNAATMCMLDGQAERAAELAREARTALRQSGDNLYYAAATDVEVALILGEREFAEETLMRARELIAGDYSALATTRRQLRLLIAATGDPEEILDPLSGPGVLHFCGHRIGGARFPFADEPYVAARIAEELEHLSPGFGYGSLANGADILVAEELVRRGAELHVVVPFARDEFVRASVADGGESWVARFEECIAAATSVTYATDDAFLGEDVLFRYASELAMGMALQRASWLDAPATQLAVWDGSPPDRAAGTAVDAETWATLGRPAIFIRPPSGQPPSGDGAPAPASEDQRVVRSLLFADVRGFSKLTDEQLPRFNNVVLSALGEVLRQYGDMVDYRNTWGDALYVVLQDPEAAAACAISLLATVKAIDLEGSGLPGHLALRLGAHIGPVFPTSDPVIGGKAFMGSHVSRTARIEPVTPPGTAYVTDAFAAALALRQSAYRCDYVGHMPAAKDYGRFRMYSLRAPVRA
jgi:class 3 adenylate cyclase